MTNLKNPYSGIPPENSKRVTTDISSNDYYLITSIRPELGTVTGILGTFWQRLAAELRKRNILDYTRKSDFESLVNSICFGPIAEGDNVTITRAEYEQLCSESANWQHECARRGFSDSPVSGTLSQTSSPDVGSREAGSGAKASLDATILPGVQSRDRKSRGRAKIIATTVEGTEGNKA